MAEEDIDLTKTCPSCASPNISLNRKGQTFCRDCGNIAPAGNVVSIGISKIKGIFSFKKKKVKGRKRAIIKKKIKSILRIKKKAQPKGKTKRKVSKKRTRKR